jgi:hypothetical protein
MRQFQEVEGALGIIYVTVHRGGPPGVPHGVAGVQLEEIHDAYEARLHEVEGRFQIVYEMLME